MQHAMLRLICHADPHAGRDSVIVRLNNSVVVAGDLEVDLKLAMQGRQSHTKMPTVVLQFQHIPRPNLLHLMEWYDVGLILCLGKDCTGTEMFLILPLLSTLAFFT
jgi:hypothetical protein